MGTGMSVRRGILLCACALAVGCANASAFFAPLFESPRRVPHKIEHPAVPGARLAALWIGHATLLLQIGDRFVLTDPVLTSSAGQISARLVEPGIDAGNLPRLDAVLISHLHFDHLSLGSLEMIEDKVGTLVMPEGGLVYLTDFDFPALELRRFQSWERDGLRVTAVPVRHNGWRYGADAAWMKTSFTGYVIEYQGTSVYFAGDTAFDAADFAATRRRFPHLDLALLPIAPIEPRDFMKRSHMDPTEALRALGILGARVMIPMHYDTFVNGFDKPGDALEKLGAAMKTANVAPDKVVVLAVGEQRVLLR